MKRPKKYSDMDGLQKLDYILLIVQLAAFALGVIQNTPFPAIIPRRTGREKRTP